MPQTLNQTPNQTIPPSLQIPSTWPEADQAELIRRSNTRTKRLPLLRWTMTNRSFLAPSRPFDLETHRFLAAIYQDTHPHIVLCKASQMGLSEYSVSYALWTADQRDGTVLYIFPTNDHVSDFSTARLGPAIEVSPYLKEIIEGDQTATSKRTSRSRTNRVTLRRVRNRFLYFRGARVKPDGQAPQLKSIDADVVILDEWDEMDPRAPVIAQKRLGHSSIGEIRSISTPTYPNFGIHSEFLKSDQHHFFFKCQTCNHWMTPTINNIVTEWDALHMPFSWHGGPHSAHVACPKCSSEISRFEPQAEWVAKYPSRSTRGYHIPKLISPRINALGIVRSLQTVKEVEMKEAYNQDLGLPYEPHGSKLTLSNIRNCSDKYLHGEVLGEQTFMGIDVGRILHVVIRAKLPNGTTIQRFAGEVRWDDLIPLYHRFDVRSCVIDALPETTRARQFQADLPRGTVWIAYYSHQKIGSKREKPEIWNWRDLVVSLDRTRTLDNTFGAFHRSIALLPANILEIPRYSEHLTSVVRQSGQNAIGEAVTSYVSSGDDHFAHAENYCFISMSSPGSGGWVMPPTPGSQA